MMPWMDWLFDRPRRHVYGWWSCDDAESTLLGADGIRVRFLGPVADDNALDIRNTGNRRWMRFELRSDQYPGHADYPLLGEHKVTWGGPEPIERMEPIFEYCDDDVRVRLHLSYGFGSVQPLSLTVVQWPRVVRGSRFHEQEGVLPSSLFRPAPNSKDSWAPQARLWHRLADAIEAWLDPAHAGERAGVTVRGLYVAGAFDWSGERKTWFEARA